MNKPSFQFLLGLAFGLIVSIIAYSSGKKAGVAEVVDITNVISTGNRYDSLWTYYEASGKDLDGEAKDAIEAHVRAAHSEFIKHLTIAEENGDKRLGLIAQIPRDLPSEMAGGGGQDAEIKP